MRTTRLNEYDLTRIVRRVLNEQPNKNNTNPCFDKATIKLPSSCTVKPLGGPVGTGFKLGNGCLSDLGSMITMKNLTEVTKILACLGKSAVV